MAWWVHTCVMTTSEDDRRSVRVSSALWDAAMDSADAEGTTVSDIMRDALARFVDAHPAKCGLCKGPRHEGLSCEGRRIGLMQAMSEARQKRLGLLQIQSPAFKYTAPDQPQTIASIMARENIK